LISTLYSIRAQFPTPFSSQVSPKFVRIRCCCHTLVSQKQKAQTRVCAIVIRRDLRFKSKIFNLYYLLCRRGENEKPPANPLNHVFFEAQSFTCNLLCNLWRINITEMPRFITNFGYTFFSFRIPENKPIFRQFFLDNFI